MCSYSLRDRFLRHVTHAAAVAVLAAAIFGPGIAWCQTPSPLQEWQYPGGIILEKLFVSDLPDWRVVLGASAVDTPRYQGSRSYRLEPGPAIDIRYQDIAFASVGDGLGVNLLRGTNYRAGVAVGYDLGRRVSDDRERLSGLGDISAAPSLKLFGSYVISKDFPLVLRADARRILGGAGGLLGDLEGFVPLPGSSQRFVMFAGPSITFANRQYTQKVFGVSARQAVASGYPDFEAHGGSNAAGLGFSATWFVNSHWLINSDVALSHLLGSASDSPLTQTAVQGVAEVTTAYRW